MTVNGRILLSTMPAGRGDRRLALAFVLASVGIFLAAMPFARTPLTPVPAFLPIYQSALIINDLFTAVLLLGQFAILQSRALQVLASGYLFSASMAVAHLLSFPGLVSPTGLLAAGPQTTAWIYFFWHGGFPLFVIIYALFKNDGMESGPPDNTTHGNVGLAILSSVIAALAFAFGLTLITTTGHALLPAIMQGDTDIETKVIVAFATWAIILAALAALWRRRPHSVLDLWLVVVMSAWVFDVALAAVLNHARYDLGWYAGRIYGLLAASFVLALLLLENGRLYAQLAAAHERERRERELAQAKTVELSALNKELEAFSYSVSHDLRAPLRAVVGYARMLEEDHAPRLDEEGKRLLDVVSGEAGRMGELIDDLLDFSRLGRKPLQVQPLDMTALARDVAARLTANHATVPVTVAIGELPATQGDRALLHQVWANLIGNSVKYSSVRESPRISISGVTEGGEQVYRVEDNGVGFDMNYADKLFGVFQRLHSQEEFPGTGVGLAIVQRVINRHGGRVWAEGRVGEGATFYFSLPALGEL